MKNENNRAIWKILDKICPRAVSKPVLEGVKLYLSYKNGSNEIPIEEKSWGMTYSNPETYYSKKSP